MVYKQELKKPFDIASGIGKLAQHHVGKELVGVELGIVLPLQEGVDLLLEPGPLALLLFQHVLQVVDVFDQLVQYRRLIWLSFLNFRLQHHLGDLGVCQLREHLHRTQLRREHQWRHQHSQLFNLLLNQVTPTAFDGIMKLTPPFHFLLF